MQFGFEPGSLGSMATMRPTIAAADNGDIKQVESNLKQLYYSILVQEVHVIWFFSKNTEGS